VTAVQPSLRTQHNDHQSWTHRRRSATIAVRCRTGNTRREALASFLIGPPHRSADGMCDIFGALLDTVGAETCVPTRQHKHHHEWQCSGTRFSRGFSPSSTPLGTLRWGRCVRAFVWVVGFLFDACAHGARRLHVDDIRRGSRACSQKQAITNLGQERYRHVAVCVG